MIASIGLTHFIYWHICFTISELVACSRCLISLGYYLDFNIFDPGTLLISVVYFVNAIGSFMAIAVFFRFHAILNRLSKTGQALHPILRLTRNMWRPYVNMDLVTLLCIIQDLMVYLYVLYGLHKSFFYSSYPVRFILECYRNIFFNALYHEYM